MLYLAWIVSLVAVFFLGYFFRGMRSELKELKEQVKQKIDKPVEEEPKSVLVDGMDEVEKAKIEMLERMEKLNRG